MAFAPKVPGPRKRPGWPIGAGLWLAAAIALGNPATAAPAAPERPNAHELSNRFPDKPSIAPSWTIPAEPLGFASPGPNYLGMRNAMASLDFLGEDRLLFTFRVPGLLRREPGSTAEDQRQIRAVVLAVPTGAVLAQTNWTVHDRARYLWMLDDSHFVLRDRDSLLEGDARLNLKPWLHFPGPLLSIDLTPERQYLVANTREPAAAPAKTTAPANGASSAASNSGAVTSPSTASASADSNDDSGAANAEPDLVLRILRRDSGQVMMLSRIRTPVRLPINNDGYLDALRGNGAEWAVELNYFTGPNRILGKVKSVCSPDLEFLSENEALVTACSDMGDDALVAMTLGGQTLWTDLSTDRLIWPLLVTARNGLRFARETLYVSHAVNAFDPLGTDDIKGQWVRVFDAATGNVAFESPATPILDAGGNVAISPSGRRVAVIVGGAIQVFELPAPPPLPDSDSAHPSR